MRRVLVGCLAVAGCAAPPAGTAASSSAVASASASASATATAPHASGAGRAGPLPRPLVDRRPPPVARDPDPLAVLPLPTPLPTGIACATPVARGKRMGDVVPLVARAKAACEAELGKSGPAPACADLALLLRRGDVVRGDAILADDVAARACASGVARACTLLAEARLTGVGASLDPPCAEKVFDHACAHDDLGACARIAELRGYGASITLDVARARKIATDACERGGYEACLVLQALPGAENDWSFGERAFALAVKACDAGDGAACDDAGGVYDSRYSKFRGSGVAVDTKKALSLFERGCKAGDTPACGHLHQRDPANAKKACDAGELEACPAVKDVDRSKLEAACLRGVDRACFALGYADSADTLTAACKAGNPLPCRFRTPDKRHARDEGPTTPEHLRLACDAGNAWSCADLSRAAASKTDLEGAFALARDACPSIVSRDDYRDVNRRGCFDAGRALLDGSGVAKDPGLAALYFRDGCYAPPGDVSRDACMALAGMYERGEGVDRSDERASDLYSGVCGLSGQRVSPSETEGPCEALDRLLGRPKGTSENARWSWSKEPEK